MAGAHNQSRIEGRLFDRLHPQAAPQVFLYDVTSTYLEGEHNAFAAWGCNRDGKRGKQQIVIGLLCDGEGQPLSIELFAANTTDPKTLGSQIKKAAERFGAQGGTFVGDRAMIKGPQEWFLKSAMADLLGADFSLAEIHQLYEVRDKLLEHKEALFAHLQERWKDLLGARFKVLLHDLTSTCFESDRPESATDKRRFGYSRDKRSDCVQVVITLVGTPEGFPLADEVRP